MKLQAITRHKFTAEYWNFTSKDVTTTVDNVTTTITERTHYLNKNVKVSLGTDNTAKIIIFCDEPMRIWGQIRNLRDQNGVEVLKDGVWTITYTEPVLTAFGTVEGYRMKARFGTE